MTICPCGSGGSYEHCCGRLHRAEANAATAEELMRSRFSAYARRDEAYLRRTWHPHTRPATIGMDDGVRWTRLDVLGGTGGALFDAQATVLFEAHFVERGRADVMREESRFVRERGEWLYVGPR